MMKVQVISLDEAALKAFSQLTTPSARRSVARNIMEGARSKLITLAGEHLNSTRMDYIQGIQPLEFDEDGVALVLSGAIPMMVEHGWDARQLHETLLRGPGVNKASIKKTADGKRYRSIPFRHKTPGAGAQGGQPMGSAYGGYQSPMSRAAPKTVVKDAAGLGKRVHKAAKKLGEGQRLPPGMAPKLRPHHSTDIYAGMKANLQPVQKAGGAPGQVAHQRTYTTFRTISENVTNKWYHPGIEARNFFDKVESYVQKVAPGAIEAFLNEGLGGGTPG